MERGTSFKKLVTIYHITRRYTPEDYCNLNFCRHDNNKSIVKTLRVKVNQTLHWLGQALRVKAGRGSHISGQFGI
jgi:hypothetical protein